MLLQTGDKGQEVKQLQEKLNKLGFSCGVPDGDFGDKTEKAVMAFQKKFRLTIDGKVGDKTIASINNLLKVSVKPPTPPAQPIVEKEKIFFNVHPEVVALAKKLRTIVKEKLGIDIMFTQGFRSFAEQNALYAKGRTSGGEIVTYAKGGESYHNYGLALDFVILTNGKADWKDLSKYDAVGKEAMKIGMEWGGTFNRIKDRPHLQKSFGLSIADLKEGKRPLH